MRSSFILALFCISTFLTACTLGGRDKPTPPPVSAPLQKTSVPISIFAGDYINLNTKGQALALLVKLYFLEDINTFQAASFETFLDDGNIETALGSDVLQSKEVLFVPNQAYTQKFAVPDRARYVGVVALFRKPAETRWRQAFSLKPGENPPITIGLHACAMTISDGTAINPLGKALDQLSTTRCPQD